MTPYKKMRRARVLLLAYACSPNRGSEPGVGWNRALHTARYCDTWVLCEDEYYGTAIRSYLQEHGDITGLHFVYVCKTKWMRILAKIPGCRYIAHRLWQKRAYQLAKKLHDEIQFDVAHQVTFCSYREPGYLWKLPIPFVWGPVGGTQNYPWRFLPEAGWRGAVREFCRSFVNRLQLRFSARIRRALKHTGQLFAANTTVQRDLTNVCEYAPQVLLETGIAEMPDGRARHANSRLRILWSGDLQPWKALSLLIKAIALLPPEIDYEVRVLGDGPRLHAWQRLARRLHVEKHIRWEGRLPFAEAMAVYHWADVFTFTSLRDTSGNVVLEAFAAGLPVVCLDHQGAHDMVTDQCGTKIPVTTRKNVVLAISGALERLARNAAQRESMSRAARKRAYDFLWSSQIEHMIAAYQHVVDRPLIWEKRETSCAADRPLVSANEIG